jgi:predicted RNA-binding protein YlqC (UPF0109 family)
MPQPETPEEQLARTRLALDILLRQMVDEPGAVTVRQEINEFGTVVFRVRVAPHEVGKIIGVGGRNVRGLRTILAAISKGVRTSYRLEIENEEAS